MASVVGTALDVLFRPYSRNASSRYAPGPRVPRMPTAPVNWICEQAADAHPPIGTIPSTPALWLTFSPMPAVKYLLSFLAFSFPSGHSTFTCGANPYHDDPPL